MLTETLLESFALAKIQSAVRDVTLTAFLSGLLFLAVAALLADYAFMLYLRARMPPGPMPWPIVGNTFSLPDKKPWIYFEELSKKYRTPLITFWIGR